MNKKSSYSLRRVCLGFVALFLTGSNTLWADPLKPDAAVGRWLKQPLATGNWGGIRDRLAKEGVNVRFTWRSQLNKVVDGGLDRSTASFQQEFKLALGLDLEKLLGIPGLGFDAVGRWRDGTNALQLAGSSAQFSPSNMEGGKSWRLCTLGLTWKSEQLLWTEDAVKARIGWLRPVDTFLQQTGSIFANNAFGVNPGLGGFPWSGSYSSWGGELRVKTVPSQYTQLGVYGAFPNQTNKHNNGLDFDGTPYTYRGVLFAAESGVTPAFGPDKLPGKYAVGMFYWGVPNTGYLGERNRANEAYYLQADQMLYREPSPATGGKDSKLNPQGLTTYNVFTYSPPANSPVPYYFQTGFSYQGLIPGRDADKIALGFAYGQYSYDKIKARRLAGQTIQRTEEAVAELSYRVQVSKFAFFQPYVQYIIKPNGDGVAPNATVLGAFMGLDF